MIECVIDAAKAELEDLKFRAYVTDALQMIAENTAKFAGGRYLTERWYSPPGGPEADADDATGDDIAADLIRRAALKVV